MITASSLACMITISTNTRMPRASATSTSSSRGRNAPARVVQQGPRAQKATAGSPRVRRAGAQYEADQGGLRAHGPFVDVFTAASVIDYYDEEGNFYTKMNARSICECLIYPRYLEITPHGPGRAGHDALSGKSMASSRTTTRRNLNWPCTDAERVPGTTWRRTGR